MYFAYPFALIQVLEKVYLVIKNGYVALYIDFASSLPYIFILIAGWFSISFYIYLATLPSKKEARVPIIIFLSIATISIGTGQRGSFVLGYLFVIMYFFLRNKLEPGNSPWIGKKGIIRILVAAPVLVAFLFLMVYIRSDRDSNFSSNVLISFLYQQGVSAEVIGYGFDYEKDFPKGKMYLIGDVKDYLKHNIFARYLFGTNKTEPQTVEHALEDNSFDSALTYFVKPYMYLEGGGLGGCYIAEAYKDLGYFGVCLVNFIYGLLLARIPLWCRKNIWISSIGLGMFSQIIFAPRAHFIKPFFIFMSVNVLLVYFYLYQISRFKVKKANNKYNI
jgi:oligosaccharide repeat unit polymerase